MSKGSSSDHWRRSKWKWESKASLLGAGSGDDFRSTSFSPQEPMHPPTVALRKFPGGLFSQVLEMTIGAHLAYQREPMHPPTVALRKFPEGLLSHSPRGSVTEL